MEISKSDVPIRCTDIWSTDNNGTTIIFSYANYDLRRYDLNLAGTFVWNLCDGDHSIEDIAELIGRLFGQRLSEQEAIDLCISSIQSFQNSGLVFIGNHHEL